MKIKYSGICCHSLDAETLETEEETFSETPEIYLAFDTMSYPKTL
jgi:hypothetical protein